MPTTPSILHPTDFSDHAMAAFDVACSLARDRKLPLVVLHVVPAHEPVAHYARALGLEPSDEAQFELKTYREEMEQKLNAIRAPDAYVRLAHLLKEGVVAKVIVQVADQMQCESIVLGTRGESAPGHALFGSVADEVCRTAPCRVITVQKPAH